MSRELDIQFCAVTNIFQFFWDKGNIILIGKFEKFNIFDTLKSSRDDVEYLLLFQS